MITLVSSPKKYLPKDMQHSVYKNLHIEPFNTVSKSVCFGFGSGYHAQLSNENLPYIDRDSILLPVSMSLPLNHILA